MTVFGKASVEAQIYRWLRHDWRRYVQPGSELEKFYEEIERKYRPDQARVPAGNPDGGRWTNEGRGSSSQGDRGGASGSQGDSGRSDPRVPSDATSDNYYTPGAQLAQNNWSSGTLIDLRAEDERGGHSIANHVGKSEAYLLNVVHQQALSTTRRGELAEGLREGSCPSLESANKLVSSTL